MKTILLGPGYQKIVCPDDEDVTLVVPPSGLSGGLDIVGRGRNVVVTGKNGRPGDLCGWRIEVSGTIPDLRFLNLRTDLTGKPAGDVIGLDGDLGTVLIDFCRLVGVSGEQDGNQIDQDLHACALQNFWNYVGTPGSTIASYGKFLAGVQRLNEMAVPTDERSAALSPADHVALLGNQAQLYIDGANSDAYRKAKLGGLAGIEPFMTQNAPTLTTGTRTNGTVNGAGQAVTYAGAQANSWGQTLSVSGLGAGGTVRAGEVFTIAGVFAVNPITKQVLPYLQQFVATAPATADGSGNVGALAIAPAIITSGAYQTVSAAPAAGAVLTWVGAASSTFQQNLMFHKNALALVVVPFEKPAGVPAEQIGVQSYKGIHVMLVPYFDGPNRISSWRLDVLYGVAAIDPRLGTRISG